MINHNYNEKKYYTEAEKNTDEYLIGNIDNAISELVNEKTHLKTAYNYYNGKMDAQEFKFLEENYGIGNPTSIEFIPLIRKHIDALVGEHLGNKLKPKITCKDKTTLDAIEEMKKKELNKNELTRLKSQFQINLDYAIEKKSNPQAQPPIDQSSEQNLAKEKEEMITSFISEFEKSAQFVISDLLINKTFDLAEKRRLLMLDLLIAGECGYKTSIVHEGQLPKLEILNIHNLFYEINPNSSYLKDSPRIVYRKYMTRDQILNRYGHLFENPKEDLENLFQGNHHMHYGGNGNVQYISAPDQIGLLAGVGTTTGFADEQYSGGNRWNLFPVYEVEWITVNKIKEKGEIIYKQFRYKGTRIGEEIYVETGVDETAIRSNDNPYECSSSFNGVRYSDRNGKPYSLMLATKNIQDKYNILHFHRDNHIANSGVKGSHVDVAGIPAWLGNTPEERVLKAVGYKKQGINLFDSSQEGSGQGNTHFAGYDESLSGQAIQAIQLAIEQTENVASGITGVFRERLGNIEQRDAVTNVEVGIKTSAVITKQYFHVMDNITSELLIDAINQCKISYKKGVVGSILLGTGKQKIFTIDPKHFCFTDYDVQLGDSSEIIQEMQEIKSVSMQLISSGLVDVDIIVDIMASQSLTDMRDRVKTSISKKAEASNNMSQMQQQLMQLQEQIKQITTQAEQLQIENEKLKQEDRAIIKDKINKDYDVRKSAVENNDRYNTEKLSLDQKRIELEKLQLFDDNTANNEISNS